jgi:hypothetical protein
MGVRRFEELVAWQLANELHRQVVEFSDSGARIRGPRFLQSDPESDAISARQCG